MEVFLTEMIILHKYMHAYLLLFIFIIITFVP